ncbi:recombinase family protein [Adlercreutzia sp. R25]|uniref:recombinase family protein n=1 Tax=Adlercreutzia shanghongiae TaxID=3111773 RepID=UPI002DC03023|nr:recombinase family protein [Adlercreutzia sp. R25]MEC4272951.1 recombinase family protein [Adlercreutzia sp. R25]
MTVYGYVRVSTAEQNVERQIAKMRGMGIDGDALFVDRCSGKDMDRPEWARLMSAIGGGDRIVVDSLDRLGRSYDLVTAEWKRITREVGCDISCLDLEFMDSAAMRAMGDVGKVVEDMMLSLLSYVAEAERKKNLQRQAEGIAIAKAAGKYKGGAPKRHDPALMAEAERALAEEGKSAAARVLGVGRVTIYRMIEDGRLGNGAA